MHLANGERPEGKLVLQKVLDAHPHDPLALSMMAGVRLAEKEVAQAKAMFTQAIEQAPELVQVKPHTNPFANPSLCVHDAQRS